MSRILDICLKDLRQIARNKLTFLFLLIMPMAFTLMFGFAFAGGSKADPRLPVGWRDEDGSAISKGLATLLKNSSAIRLDETTGRDAAKLQKLVADGKLAAAVIIPAGYGDSLRKDEPVKFDFIVNPGNSATSTVQQEAQAAASRLTSSVKIASIVAENDKGTAFEESLQSALASWQDPPVKVNASSSSAILNPDAKTQSMAQSSPGMMLQFAIASLLTAGTVIVNERKTRSLQRLLTTSTSRFQILMGHFLAIFVMIFGQFILLLIFGQLALKVDYFRNLPASLLVAFCAAVCISALGLLIGVFAKSEEQAIIYSLIPMFILAGLGGAWVPLEVTGATFRAVGHVSPVAWAIDGFKNITLRGMGFGSALLPAAALFGYAIVFFGLAAWRFRRVSE